MGCGATRQNINDPETRRGSHRIARARKGSFQNPILQLPVLTEEGKNFFLEPSGSVEICTINYSLKYFPKQMNLKLLQNGKSFSTSVLTWDIIS